MFYRLNIWLAVLSVTAMLSACSPSIRETRDVVAQADSLWHAGQMYGVDAGDSATLAHTYETLNVIPFPFREGLGLGSSYAHACYHYGKLLRAKDNPVAAMEVFINATHSRTRDYHILGRVYNNMGDICHMAGDYALSYDMFEHSGDMFLHDKDTLSYYYVLNDMAFELAEQGKKDSCFLITHELINLDKEGDMLTSYCCVSQAQACLKKQEYDSVIHYVYKCQSIREESAMALLLAQAYSYMEIRDSAVFYAELVLEKEPTLEERNNALYILTNDDDTKDRQAVLETAGERSDMQKLIEIKRSKHAQAVQLLEEEINRKPDRRWIFTLVAVLLFVLIAFAFVYLLKKRKEHRRLIQDIHAQKQIHTQLSKTIDTLSNLHEAHSNEIMADIDKSCQILRNNQDIHNHLHWNNYNEMCEYANRYLYNIIIQLQPFNLSEKEIRLCVLVLIKATTEQMVELIPYAHSGLGKFKYTIARKLGTTTSKMREFMLDLLR